MEVASVRLSACFISETTERILIKCGIWGVYTKIFRANLTLVHIGPIQCLLYMMFIELNRFSQRLVS
jgi:hypothetical protein